MTKLADTARVGEPALVDSSHDLRFPTAGELRLRGVRVPKQYGDDHVNPSYMVDTPHLSPEPALVDTSGELVGPYDGSSHVCDTPLPPA